MKAWRLSIAWLGASALLLHASAARASTHDVELSPAAWGAGELERFTALQNTFAGPTPPPVVSARQALIAGTSERFGTLAFDTLFEPALYFAEQGRSQCLARRVPRAAPRRARPPAGDARGVRQTRRRVLWSG